MDIHSDLTSKDSQVVATPDSILPNSRDVKPVITKPNNWAERESDRDWIDDPQLSSFLSQHSSHTELLYMEGDPLITRSGSHRIIDLIYAIFLIH